MPPKAIPYGMLLPDVPVSPSEERFPSPQMFNTLMLYPSSQLVRPISPQAVFYQQAPVSPAMQPLHIHQSYQPQFVQSQQQPAGLQWPGTPQRSGSPVRPATPGGGVVPIVADAALPNVSSQETVMTPTGFQPTSKAKAGIGITSGRINNNDLSGAVYILAVHPNGAAARMGKLEPMQELVSVDGWPVLGQPMHVITERVIGIVGTVVTLEVYICSCLGFCS